MSKDKKIDKKENSEQEEEQKPSIINEFKTFVTRGNVIDIAVGLTVGAAFTKVANSLVMNVIMPPIGMLIGGSAFSDLYIPLDGVNYENLAAAEAASAPLLKYGLFISDLVDFLIIAIAIFLVIKVVSRMQHFKVPIRAPKSLRSFL